MMHIEITAEEQVLLSQVLERRIHDLEIARMLGAKGAPERFR
jgi:uncharacterized protein YaaN involved in tellurite resistance